MILPFEGGSFSLVSNDELILDVSNVSECAPCLCISVIGKCAYSDGIVPLITVLHVVVSTGSLSYLAVAQIEHDVVAVADDIAFYKLVHGRFAEFCKQRRSIIAFALMIIIGASSLADLQHGLFAAAM